MDSEKQQFTKSMKKHSRLLLIVPILLVLGGGFFFLFLPSLVNLYLLPGLIAELPFAEKDVRLFRITPWSASGTVSLADPDRPGLLVPRFEVYYSPGSLIRGKITGLIVDSASVHIDMLGGHPAVRGLSGKNSPASEQSRSNDNRLAVALPLAIESITLKNCRLTLHYELGESHSLIIDGHVDLGFAAPSDNGRLLTSAVGRIETRGDMELTGTVDLQAADNKYEAATTLSALHIRQDNFSIDTTASDPPITLQLSGNLEKARFALNNLIIIKPEQTSLAVEGEIQATKGIFQGVANIIPVRTQSAVAIQFNGTTQQSTTTIDYVFTGEAFKLAEASFGPVKAEGNISIKGTSVSAQMSGKIPAINLKKWDTRLVNLSFALPLHYPPQAGGSGSFKIDQLIYQNSNSGALQATVSQTQSGVIISSVLTTPFAPGLQLLCNGSALMTGDLTAHCRIPATKIDSSTFPGFFSLPEKLSLNGTLAAKGELHITNMQPTGKISAEIHEGSVSQGKNKLSDIDIAMVFPRLPLLQSAPSQLCTIGTAQFGKIQLADGRIRFRIEDTRALFVENMQMSWCGGKVETGSLALAREMEELEVTLYCDRIGFTELLAQFGIDKAEGQGSLNGRLPMLISRKRVLFDDGFLFSTPGNSGIVRFKDTRQLRQGIPDINQSSYLDYSMQALENFAYNWTKLSFNSLDNDLLITMQLDGKPAEPLPFTSKDGQIVPSATGTGMQHPIRLDVNFRLPINDLFQYGTSIQSMMEKM